MSPRPELLTSEIDSAIEDFADNLAPIERRLFSRLQILLKGLDLTADGDIKTNIANLKLINKIKREAERVILSDDYAEQVDDLLAAFEKIAEVQTIYFRTLEKSFKKPALVEELRKLAVSNTAESLTEAGIRENVVAKVTELIEQNIKTGSSFAKMNKDVQEIIMGEGKEAGGLVSYSKQITTDSLSQFAANYNKVVTEDLDMEWFQYVGNVIDTTRPFCEALLEKEFIHRSELGKVAHGIIDGEEVSTAGMIEGTNASNFQIYRGGYNCRHQLIPVLPEFVPKEIREKFGEEEE